MASTVETLVTEAAPVKLERLPVGQPLSPDASSSCRGGQITMIHRYLPVHLAGGAKWSKGPDFQRFSRASRCRVTLFWIRNRGGVTCRLIGQRQMWEAALE